MDARVFLEEVNDDIQERERNLTLLKTIPTRYGFHNNDQATWIRCSFPIIYAELEGFFVNTATLYLRQINTLSLKKEQLGKHYLVRDVEKKFKQINNNYPQKLDKRHSFINSFIQYCKNDSVDLNTEINTESNLGFQELNGILETLNLSLVEDHVNHDAYSLKDDLNKFLLDTRNGIAHGNPTQTITTDDITKAIDLVKYLMEIVKSKFEEGLEKEVFLAEK